MVPNDEKPAFDIPALITIQAILESRLGFLNYSTQKRNLAYLLQFLEFQWHLFDRYRTYGSVRAMMLRQIVLTAANVIEYLLYVSVRQHGQKPGHVFKNWINQAKNLRLIEDKLSEKLHEVRKWRNRLHPDSQLTQLDYNDFTDAQVHECILRLEELMRVLREHFRPEEVQTKTSHCPNPEFHTLVLSVGDVCPYCSEIVT